MASLTPQEKRRILQERRMAKMKGGQATDRLNNILNNGSSVKSDVTSVLDKEHDPQSTATNASINAPSPTYLKPPGHEDDDPDTSDIEQLLSHRASPSLINPLNNSPGNSQDGPDMDYIMNAMFGNMPQNSNDNTDDPMTKMMMNMMQQQQQSEGENPENLKDLEYEKQLLAYNTFKQKQLKFNFLIIRYLSIIINFSYHFVYSEQFRSSSYDYIRKEIPMSNEFTIIFLSIEAVILSSYFLISSKRKASENMTSDNILLKIISMASMFIPILSRFQSLLVGFLGYVEILNMFIGDLALVVILFGITSYLK